MRSLWIRRLQVRVLNAKRFSAVVRSLARVPAQVARKTAADISREIQRSMDASKDPDGGAWKPKKNGQPSVLKKTGRGRESIEVAPTSGAGLKITVGTKYMPFHQFGTSRMVARRFLPTNKLPDRWGAIILGNIEAAAKQVLR